MNIIEGNSIRILTPINKVESRMYFKLDNNFYLLLRHRNEFVVYYNLIDLVKLLDNLL